MSIQIHHYETGEVEDVSWDWTEEQKAVPVRARAVQTVLYAYADAKQTATPNTNKGWVDIEDAAARATQIQSWLEDFKV